MDSSELMASGLDDHNNERRSFPMVPPLKRVAEEASAAASSALSPVKKACSDLTDESAMNDWDAELKQELHDNDAWSVSVVDCAMTDSDTELNQELDCEDIDLFSSFRWYRMVSN
ncbi:hypothetical protein AXF42_Ash021016 [Apostasia shenzhenica]|uniref:Uncharacterized protein n=1 Tax=Apostasia shenzhenica TaxID=1088818 RepID=A0A2I0A570_9ASPA|nr:hypothetical protein AXF42_Ash021016 [Apostasia shenzhenica]